MHSFRESNCVKFVFEIFWNTNIYFPFCFPHGNSGTSQGEKLIRHYDQNMRTNWLFADVFVWCGIFPEPVGWYCMLLEPKTTIYTQQESTRMWFTTKSGSREVHNKSKSPKFDRCEKMCTLLDFGSQIHNLIILISTIPIYQNRSISIFSIIRVGGGWGG